MSSPIFVLSAGWRSGSTLLQRAILSTGKALIWGETGGAIECLAAAYQRFTQMNGPGGKRFRFGLGGNGAAQYAQFRAAPEKAKDLWIASMTSPEAADRAFYANMLKQIYEPRSRALGYDRWGVKEVQIGMDAASWLRDLFPDAKFLFLVRNPLNAILSIKRRAWIDHTGPGEPVVYFARHWRKLAQEFRQAKFGHLLRFEDFITNTAAQDQVSEYLHLPPISPNFLRSSHADWPPDNSQTLTAVQRFRIRLIAGPEMKCYGYA